jgi:hypothetical protein
MVQTMNNKNNIPQYYDYTPRVTPKPQTVIIIYDQPKVVIVRRYTRTIIPRVNPDEYRKQFDRVLLDTAALLELTRRLNIQDNMVNIIHFFSFIY